MRAKVENLHIFRFKWVRAFAEIAALESQARSL
jgi:hypothetical protein